MSLTLTPFYETSYVFPSYNSLGCQLDRDLARIISLLDNTSPQPRTAPDAIHHRHPNYSYEETEQHANLEVELPGVENHDVSVDLDGDTLVIKANRYSNEVNVPENLAQDPSDANPTDNKPDNGAEADDEEMNGADCNGEKPAEPKPSVIYKLKLRIARKYDTENISASMEGNGILRMVIPIKKKDSPRMIQIQ